MTQANVHLIEDKNLGGLLREYVESDRMADEEDFIIHKFKDGGGRFFTGNKRYEVIHAGRNGEITVIDDEGGEHILSFAYYKTLDPTDIIRVAGVRYKLVDRKAEIGEKVVIVNTLFDYGDAGTIGDVFTVEAVTNDCCYGDEEYLYGIYVIESDVVFLEREYRVLEPVNKAEIYVDGKKVAETPLHSEAIEVDESQASPEVIEMLGNLAVKIKRLEDEIDTLHSNQKRMAEELANVKTGTDLEIVIAELAKLLARESRKVGR